MITKLALTIALLLAAATAVSAQDTTPPADSGGGGGDAPSTETSEPGVAPHGVPSCPHTDSSCVWGQLFDISGPGQILGHKRPMQEGPIDVCHSWDYSCSAPVQTVCELHGPHGWWGGHRSEEGSFFFVLRTNQGWRIKPRVAGSHLSWQPPQLTVPRGATPGTTDRDFEFHLLGSAPSTSICD